MGLSDAAVQKLSELFDILDQNQDGFLQLEEFAQLGEAMLGKRVSTADAKAQLDCADIDKDGQLNLSEWLAYSQILAKLEESVLIEKLTEYGAKVHALREQKADGER